MVEIIELDVEDDGVETPELEKSISRTEMRQRSIKLPDAVVRDIIEKKGPKVVKDAIKDRNEFTIETFLGDSGVKSITYRASATSYERAAYQTKSEFWGDLVSNLSIERNTPVLFSWDKVQKGFTIKLKNPIPIPASLPLPVQSIALVSTESKGALGVGEDAGISRGDMVLREDDGISRGDMVVVEAGTSVMVGDVVAASIEGCLFKAMYIRVKHSKTTHFIQCIQCDPTETVLEIKQKLSGLIDQAVNDQRLILAETGDVLDDGKTLADQKV